LFPEKVKAIRFGTERPIKNGFAWDWWIVSTIGIFGWSIGIYGLDYKSTMESRTMKNGLWFLLSCSIISVLPVFAVCPSADLTRDCYVDLADLTVLVESWLVESPECPSADLNGDCRVDSEDLSSISEQWLTGDRLPEDMVVIPAGTFRIGNTTNRAEGASDEFPNPIVTLDSFAIGKYTITNYQYCQYLNSTKAMNLIRLASGDVYQAGANYWYCKTSTSYSSNSQITYTGGQFKVRSKSGRSMANDPVIELTWFGAVAYCNWRSQQEGKNVCYNLASWSCDFTKKGYRLPTEAQWEYAVRGGLSGQRFPWGDTITHSQANYFSDNSYSYDISATRGYHPAWNDGIVPYTSPVGSFAPNQYGIFDIGGNVREWCNDWYRWDYCCGPYTNPTGPEVGSYRILRGGDWSSIPYSCRNSYRGNASPQYLENNVGFRVVLGLK
jgi:formylglycine-generating enzyme required for sulfatase activity